MVIRSVLLSSLLYAVTASPIDVFYQNVTTNAPVPDGYRIPSLVQTANGTLLAFAESRMNMASDCSYKWIVMRRSVDGGQTWGDVVNVAGFGNTNYATGNQQVVFNPLTHTVYVAYSVGRLGACDLGIATYIVDDGGSDGQIWGTPRNISAFLGAYSGILPGPGNAVVTSVVKPGRIVFAGHLGAYVEDNVFYSDDNGVTFNVAAPGTASILAKMDEAAIAEMANGTLMLNLRNDHLNATCKCRAVSYSHDGGETWSPIVFDPVLISPVCEASLVRINDRLYFSNPASTTARYNLTIRRTKQNSTEWEQSSLLLLPGSAGDGYSAIAPGELIIAPTSTQLNVLHPMPSVRGASSGLGGIFYEAINQTRPSGDGFGKLVIQYNTFPLDF